MKKTVLFVIGFLFLVGTVWGQIQLYSCTLNTINFDDYQGSGFALNPSFGQLDSDAWATNGMSDGSSDFGDTQTSGDFARGMNDGFIMTGGFYAFEISPGNYSFGIQPGGSDWTLGTITLRIQNKTGSALTKLNLQYDVYINNDQPRANFFNFSYSDDNITYTPISTLDYTSPEVSDGNGFVLACTRLTNITTLDIANDEYIYIRWSGNDVSGLGYRDEFALDNILLSDGDTPLPVNLSSFYVIYTSGFSTLYWTTQTEENNDYWNIYRGASNNFAEAAHLNANDPVSGNGTTNYASDYIYIDTVPVIQNSTYWYWIEDVSTDGETEIHEPITLDVPFEETPNTYDIYGLHQNYPNPFNPSTSISFSLEIENHVELIIYNVKGEKIKSIFNDHVYADQINSVVWDGNDANGKQVSSGVYFYKLITDTKEYQRKMLLVK